MDAAVDVDVGEVTELVQKLIRNRCVNDGTPESGGETRNVDLLAGYLDGVGLDVERYSAREGRDSLVATIAGRDPEAPSLTLLGHTDVVPVNEDRWSRDPFGGEIVDGEVWGRGAIDMFNLTASMAVAVRRLAESGFAPRGTLRYIAVADEEAAGIFGAKYLVENEADAVRSDFLITESGGFPIEAADGSISMPVLIAEKGTMSSRIHVTGTPGHGSMPYGTDNALVKAAEVVRRLDAYEPPTRVSDHWRRFVEGFGYPPELTGPLTDEDTLAATCAALPAAIGKVAYSCNHTTLTPTVMTGGTKRNVIPDSVDIELDIRTLPGDDVEAVGGMIREALDDLADDVEFDPGVAIAASSSPTDTRLWDSLTRVADQFYAGSALLPMLMPGATDSRHFRTLGTTCYGFGIYSREMELEKIATMAHGDDERIDLESLRLIVDMWDVLVRDVVG